MNKNTAFSLLLASFLVLAPNFSFANQKVEKMSKIEKIASIEIENKDEVPKDIKITSPKEIASISESDKVVLSGTASPGDSVNIDVYSLIIAKNSTDDVLVPLEQINFTINELGIFAQEISLKKGDNLLICKIKRNNKEFIFKYIVTYSDDLKVNLMEKIETLSKKDIIK